MSPRACETVPPASLPPAVFEESDSLPLKAAEWGVPAAVIDTAHGLAYFANGTTPGLGKCQVTKVRLSDFSRVATLELDQPKYRVFSAVIDPAHDYAYFGIGGYSNSSYPAKIVRVRLSDFTKVGSGGLAAYRSDVHISSAVIDPLHGYAYFGVPLGERRGIAKIRLSDLTVASMLQLQAEGTTGSAVIDPANGYAYFMLAGLGYSSLGKIRLSDFTRVDDLVFTSPWLTGAAAIDPAKGYAYFGASKIRLSDFKVVGMLPGWDPEHGPGSAAIDADKSYLYWGIAGDPGMVMRIDLGNTRTTLTSSANPSKSGQSIRFTATVGPIVPNSGTPAGVVQFQVDGTNLEAPVTLSGGSAPSSAVSNLSVGNHTITALYSSPNASWNDSKGTLTQAIVAQPNLFYLPLVVK